MKVVVLAGGRSSEHQRSLGSAAAAADALRANGHEVLPVTVARTGGWFHEGERLTLRPPARPLDCDVVFPMLHGRRGEDGSVQGLLELLDVPYVGAGVLTSSLCVDKLAFKDELAARGVPQPGYVAVPEQRWRRDPDAVRDEVGALGLPILVRPARLGAAPSAIKVSEPRLLEPALERIFAHGGLAVVEQDSSGLVVECSVIGLDDPTASVPGERDARESGLPARISPAVTDEVRRLARETFLHVGCAGFARVGLFVEDERVLVDELDTLPCFAATSAFPRLWAASGLPLPALCERLIGYAFDRFRVERPGLLA